MKRIITKITIATLTFLAGILVVTSNTHAQSLDPNNPAARPNADVLREMGISVVRIVLKDDQNTRDYVKQMQDNGIRVIGIISWEYNSAAYHPGGAVSSEYVARFSDAVRQAYATYGGLYSYQVWNEPDSTGPADQGTSKVIPPESYGQLLAAAAAVLHGNNQHVLSAGFISGNDAYLRAVMASLGGVFPADGVAIHPYVPDPSQPGSIESVIAWIAAMRALTGRDVFITEYGWGTPNQQAQADWLLAVQNLLNTQEGLALAMWYGWSDAQVAGLGLFDINGNPKLAALVLQSLLLNGVAPGDLRALVDAGLIVECKTLAGEFMGYAYNQAQCALFVPCLDKDGNVLGYAMSQAFCSEKQKLRACSGPINLEQKLYDREVIGFGSGSAAKPWELEAILKNKFFTEFDNDDSRWDDLVADTIEASLKVEPAKYQHTDFTSWISQRWGSLNGGDDNYIENKAKNVFLPNEPQATMPLQYALFAPGTNIPGNFTLNREEFIKDGESATTYTKRVMGSQDEKLGYKATITNPIFRGCMQAAICDPEYEEDCLVKRTTVECDKDIHSREDCIGAGREIDFVAGADTDGGISLIESNEIYSMARGMWLATAAIVQDPTKDVMEDVPGTRDLSGFVESDSTYAQTETDKIYADRSSPVSSAPTKQPEPLVSEDKTYVAKAYAQGPPPYGNDPAPYCQGMRLLIENKGTEYAVKAWSDMADGCLMAPDWAGVVTYYLNGEKIGGCTIPKHRSAGIPRWDPNGDDDERYGMSVTDQLSGPCKVPITPSTPGVLSVEFRVTESSEPGDVAGCYKTPYCECPPDVEACRTTELPKPDKIVNCQLCNTWAPAEYCNKIDVDDLKDIDLCAEGYCEIKDAEVVLGESTEYEDGQSFVEWIGGLIPDSWGWGFGESEGDNTAYHFTCKIEGNLLIGFDVNCGFNMREVYLYGYIDNGQIGTPGLMGNLNKYRSAQDIQVYNGLSMIPGINEDLFALKPTRHETSLQISVGNDLTTNLKDEYNDCSTATDKCLSLEVAGGDDIRDFYVEYPDHYEQMAAHCVTQAQLSIETDDFPESQAEFCEPILDQLRDPNVKESLLNKNRFDKLAVYSGGGEPSPNLASDKNTSVVAEVNVDKPRQVTETTTSEEKYELLATKLTSPSIVADNLTIESLESDLKIIYQKYIYKYGVDALMEMKRNNEPPEDLILELKELEKTYNL